MRVTMTAVILMTLTWSALARGQATTRPSTRPVAPEEVAREVDRQEMVDGLLGQAGDAKITDRILVRMRRSYEHLAQKYDAGPITQEIQRRIVDDLIKAMEQARRQMQQQPSSQTRPSETRPQRNPQDKSAKPDPQEASQTAKQKAQAAKRPGPKPASRDAGGRPEQVLRAGALDETRRMWGNMPPRDRDEVVQGLSEEVIDKYRRQVNRYYESLSNQD